MGKFLDEAVFVWLQPLLASLMLLAATPAWAADEPREDLGVLTVDLPGNAPAGHPAQVLITPWVVLRPDTYVVRYFPGLTYRQGQAPVSAADNADEPISYGGPALGVGLEGRSPDGYGWQVLANWSPSPLAPAPDPRLGVHGFWLPYNRLGFDADVGFDTRGGAATELGTNYLFGLGAIGCENRLRFAAGRSEGGGIPGYGYGEASLWRDDVERLGLTSALTLFSDQTGARRASLDGWHTWLVNAGLRVATSASVGAGDATLPLGRRLGVGLQAAAGMTADARVAARGEVATPLARGLHWGWQGVAVMRRIEGALYVEGATTRGASDNVDGPRAGVGCEVAAITDTFLGPGLAVGLGVAVPTLGRVDGPKFYVTTMAARFGPLPGPVLGPFQKGDARNTGARVTRDPVQLSPRVSPP